VFGSTITVTNTNDSGPGSLRNAIATAADGDTIDFSLPYPATITVGTPLAIESSTSKTLTINGPGASLLAISGGNAVSVFVVQPLGGLGGAMTVTISGPYQGDETITCLIPGHEQPGEEVIADELEVTNDDFQFRYAGVCGFAARFDYSGEALRNL